ncbi:hypothetical protein [Streptomyces sp. NPDC002403]
MATKKILMIKLEIEVNDTVTRSARLEDTYTEIVRAAADAARQNMPKGSIEQITTHATWEYRHWDPEPVSHPKGVVSEPKYLTEEDYATLED